MRVGHGDSLKFLVVTLVAHLNQPLVRPLEATLHLLTRLCAYFYPKPEDSAAATSSRRLIHAIASLWFNVVSQGPQTAGRFLALPWYPGVLPARSLFSIPLTELYSSVLTDSRRVIDRFDASSDPSGG